MPDARCPMPDGGGSGDRSQTADALPGVIEGLPARGHTLARVDGPT
ncbi:hypothetical protein ACIHEI_35770 [Kitasatospora sp. NPDC051984]